MIYFERFHSKKLENLKETDQFTDIYDLPKLNLEDVNSLNRSNINKEIKVIIKSFSSPRLRFIAEFYQIIKEEPTLTSRGSFSAQIQQCAWNLARDVRQEKDPKETEVGKKEKKMKLFLVLHCYTLVPKRPNILFQMTLRTNKYFWERRKTQNQHTNATSIPTYQQ